MSISQSKRFRKKRERIQVIVRGYSVMRCYWASEEQTKKEITEDRWYHSG